MDRRKEERFPARERVELTFVSSPGVPHLERQTLYCTMQDVSVGGLNVRTYTHIPTRTVVDVSVRTEDTGAQLRRTGVVVWEEKNQEDIVVSHRLGIRLAPVPAPVANTWLRRLCSPQAVCC